MSHRILLVDDSDEARLIARMYLHGLPYSIDEAVSAEEALKLLDGAVYAAVLLDVELPKMSGPDCASAIRKLGGYRAELPIIALTGHTASDEIQRIMDAGCSAYLSKPLSKQALLQELERALGLRTLSDAGPADPLVADLASGYLENRRKDLIKARGAVAQGDFAVPQTIGHNMRGTGPSYGFPALGALGARIETEAVARDAGRLESSLRELEALLSEQLSKTRR